MIFFLNKNKFCWDNNFRFPSYSICVCYSLFDWHDHVMIWKRFPYHCPLCKWIPQHTSGFSSQMQSFSVSFVVSLNKLLNQQFSCWWFERLCHCKVTHLCHIMILLQNIIFCYFVYLPSEYTHMLQNLLFRFSVIWCVGQSDELLGWGQLIQCRVGGCWESPWHLIFPCPASCMPYQHPQWLWLTTDQWQI